MPVYDLNTIGQYTKERLGIRVDREIAGYDNGEDPIFEVIGGPVKMNLLFGIVTDTMAGAGSVMLLHMAGTLADHFDLSIDSADFDTDAIGTVYILPATAGGAITTDGGGGINLCPEWILPVGELMLHAGAAGTGTIKWSLFYVPLVEGAYVVAHA
jgi:hypothetical protein